MLTGLQKIKEILDNIPKTDLPLTFKYLESQPNEFPAGCVTSLGFQEEPFDSANNLITETFVISLIYPQESNTEGYEKWLSLADIIATEFRKKTHQNLDGQAIMMNVKQGLPPEFSENYSQPVVIFGIEIEAKILKSINT